MKIEPTQAAIATAEAEKAQPSWSVAASSAAETGH
jgi:DNA-binding XRE family transcriptional regulator